ncbi:MAG TPA: glycoside hydrolase family 2 protein, partial [Tichowtungia sp.]|nr:glycoside hydrolase family 2 protein [Tichowtungia sp.]
FIDEYGARNTLLFVKLSENQTVLSENFSSFVKPKHLELCRPELDVALGMIGETTAELTVSAQRPALWCWIECLDEELEIRFPDNFFHVVPGEARSLTLELSEPKSADELSAALRVQTLYNTTNPGETGTVPAAV